MRKSISIIALCALVLSALSCQVTDADSSIRTGELGTFTDNMVGDVIIVPVKTLTDCETQSLKILEPGFETTQNGIFIELTSAEDSLWTASNAVATDQLNFSTLIKMLPDSPEGFHRWRVEGGGTYYENETYMATLETVSTGVMEWVENRTSTSFTLYLTLTGSFVSTTKQCGSGKVLDRCTVTYEKSELDTNSRSYKATISK